MSRRPPTRDPVRLRPRRPVGRLATVVVLVAVLAAACTSGRGPAVAQEAPPLAGTQLGGERFDLQQDRGHWVIVAFQASTCAPCTEELPIMVDFASAHPEVRLVSVGLAETPEDFSAFLAPFAITWPAVPDRDGTISEGWKVDSLPVTVMVDPEGKLRQRWTGVVDQNQLAAALT